METIIKVLLVDDKEDYCQSLVGVGRQNNLNIVYKLDWESGFELLKNDTNIEFVILDGKGKIEEDQGVEKDNFVFRAINDITKWSSETKKDVPYCVNTGFMERFDALQENAKIFQKTDKDRIEMFEFIKKEVDNSEYRSIRMEFNEPFKAFDLGIIKKSHEHLLLNIIKAYQKQDYQKKNLTVQRDLLEAIFKSLNSPIPCIPNCFFESSMSHKPNLESCVMYLEGRVTEDRKSKENYKMNVDINRVTRSAIRKVKESTNEYSHLKESEIVKYPFLSNSFLLFEILIWLPEFVKEHYENYI